MRPYILTRRKESGTYYVLFCDVQNNKYSTKKSTGSKDKKEADKIALKWLMEQQIPERINAKSNKTQSFDVQKFIKTLLVTDLTFFDTEKIIDILKQKQLLESAVLIGTPESQTVEEFMVPFWNFDVSPYVKERLARGHSIHRSYCNKNIGYIKNYWLPKFGTRSIGSINQQEIKLFLEEMANEGRIRGGTINKIIRSGTISLQWAKMNGLITTDAFSGLVFCSPHYKKREILTIEQAAAVFKAPWKDETSRMANMVAMCTGMRAGEILALRLCDIGIDRLYVRHSWSRTDLLKNCKNEEEREVPLLAEIRDMLLAQVAKNPFNEGLSSYVFFGTVPSRPIDSKAWLNHLRKALKEIGHPDPQSIAYHAWRHLYTARMADHIEQRKLQRATGHKTQAMLEHYANHAEKQDFADLSRTAETVFLPLLEAERKLDQLMIY